MKSFPLKKWIVSLFALATAGLIFSAYLSGIKLFTGTCAFNESCPYFLGLPACWYGFAMYLIMFIVSGAALAWEDKIKKAILTDIIVSSLGILFAGRFVVLEFLQWGITGTLGFSTCVYGLIFYIAIFIVAGIAYRKI
jgi:hypothetical protein